MGVEDQFALYQCVLLYLQIAPPLSGVKQPTCHYVNSLLVSRMVKNDGVGVATFWLIYPYLLASDDGTLSCIRHLLHPLSSLSLATHKPPYSVSGLRLPSFSSVQTSTKHRSQ